VYNCEHSLRSFVKWLIFDKNTEGGTIVKIE
jgi:hypothetical protein